MIEYKQQAYIGIVLGCLFSFLFFVWHFWGYRTIRKQVEQYEQEHQQTQQQPAVILDNDVVGEDEELFTVLNRTPDYLRETAVVFARSYDLGETVLQLYTKSSSEPVRQKQPRKKKKKAARRRYFSEVDYARWDTHKKVEPIFDVPIDRNSFG